MPDCFTLYRFYAADDTLLYVGLTINPGRRMEKHRATQPWWNDVARIEMEQHPDIDTLRLAEREAIKTENPVHNVRMNGKQRPPVNAFVWTCAECNAPISDEDGYLTVNYDAIFRHVEAYCRFDEMLDARSDGLGFRTYVLSEMPDVPRAKWVALHRRCDPNPESNDYWISVERIRTSYQALHWSAHLMAKDWLLDTNWDRLITGLAGPGFP